MSRYKALRRIGCGPFSAGVIAFLNWMRGYPPNRIVFLTLDIEIVAAAIKGEQIER
jgi:hypothetical protein